MCTCGYTPFLDRSFTPESFNTLSRASSSWTHFVKRPYNHLALCGWCSTLRVGTCSTSVSTSMGSISPHSRDTLITSPRTLRVVLDSTRRHVLNLLLAHLSLRERFGAFLWKASLLFFSSFYRAPLGFTLSHTPPLSKVLAQMLNQRTCRCPLLPSVSVVTDKY